MEAATCKNQPCPLMNDLGKLGEDLAAFFLKKKGYEILERNFRIRGGELDIVAIDTNTLVYIEVKTRTSHLFGKPEESITPWKLKHLEKSAKFYRSAKTKYGNLPDAERIDVITVDFTTNPPAINHIQNAGF